MDGQTIVTTVGYVTAGIVLLAGIAIIVGLVLPAYVPDNYRIIVGIVLFIYGVYRSVMLWIKQKSQREEFRRERQAE